MFQGQDIMISCEHFTSTVLYSTGTNAFNAQTRLGKTALDKQILHTNDERTLMNASLYGLGIGGRIC